MQGRRVWAAWYGAGGRAVACGDKGTRGLLWSGQTSGVFKDTHPIALPPPPTASMGGGASRSWGVVLGPAHGSPAQGPSEWCPGLLGEGRPHPCPHPCQPRAAEVWFVGEGQ